MLFQLELCKMIFAITTSTHLSCLVHHGHTKLCALHARMARTVQRSEQNMRAVDAASLSEFSHIRAVYFCGHGVQGM